MIDAPLKLQGSWFNFYREHIVPNLPSISSVDECHQWMLRYSEERDSIFPVRAAGKAQRRRVYSTCDGTRIAPADNSPAWAFHARLIKDEIRSYADFKRHIVSLPSHFHDVRERTINRHGWYVAHIYPAKNGNTDFRSWDRDEVVRRFFLAIHPCNLFFVPLLNRIDGEDPRVIAFIAKEYSKRYRTTWSDFVRRVQGARLRQVPGFGSQNISVNPARLISDPNKRAHEAGVSKGRRYAGAKGIVRYSASRLTFKSRIIEPLRPDQAFEVDTPAGVFRLTKRDFYTEFKNVVSSGSYRLNGNYSYPVLPRKAGQFRLTKESGDAL